MKQEQQPGSKGDLSHPVADEMSLMKDFFMNSPALFCFVKEPEHVFQFANPRFEQVFGQTGSGPKTFGEVYPQWDKEGLKKILDDVYITGTFFSAKAMRIPLGNKPDIYLDINCQAFRDAENNISGILFFAYEVTDQVLVAQHMQLNKTELESSIREHTESLKTSNKLLQESNKNLQEFASIASHDLQEPLRKIKTFTSILNTRHAGELSDAVRKLVLKTQESANRMSALIRDVLNYSRVVVPENSLAYTDLNVVINNVINDFDLLAEEKKAVFHIQPGIPVIEAVPLQMNQLFYNLVSNSLKFSSTQREPVIEISWKLLTGDEIKNETGLLPGQTYYQFLLHDNGIGFEQQFAEQIFSIFERLNAASSYEGTGIGLALCRKIVENHHGIIRAKSEEKKGSSFFITLPERQ